MSASWQRWLAYAKAKLDSSLKESEADLDQREARLRAEAEGKPWLSSSTESPTFDEMRARIEHDARESAERQRRQAPGGARSPSRPGPRLEGGPTDAPSPSPPSGVGGQGPAPAAGVSTGVGEDPLASFDMAAHQKAADERLAAIRRELGLADDGDDGDPPPPAPPPPSPPPPDVPDLPSPPPDVPDLPSPPPDAPGPPSPPDAPSADDDGGAVTDDDGPDDDTPVAPV